MGNPSVSDRGVECIAWELAKSYRARKPAQPHPYHFFSVSWSVKWDSRYFAPELGPVGTVPITTNSVAEDDGNVVSLSSRAQRSEVVVISGSCSLPGPRLLLSGFWRLQDWLSHGPMAEISALPSPGLLIRACPLCAFILWDFHDHIQIYLDNPAGSHNTRTLVLSHLPNFTVEGDIHRFQGLGQKRILGSHYQPTTLPHRLAVKTN